MRDDFASTKDIVLKVGTSSISYSFKVTACSAADQNDGAIPYGTTVSSVVVSAYNLATDTDVTSTMVVSTSPTPSDNVIPVKLNYPGGNGQCYLKFLCTLSDSSVIPLHFPRIYGETA